MDDLRWFAPNRFCTLVVPALRRAGLTIATEGDGPAGLAVAMDGQCAVAGFEYARRHKVPLLLYVWDLPPWRLGTGRPDVIFSWRGRLQRVPRLIGRFPERPGYYSRVRYVARRADAVWVPSHLTQDDVRRRFGVEATVVPFCFDSDRFRPTPWVAATPTRLVAVSRLVAHKNHAAVLRAAARFTPMPQVQLIGEGPEAVALRALASELGVRLELDDQGAGDGVVDRAYHDATVVVAPSRFEGFGLTPMEAIASNRPVVASDIPVHREHLGDAANYFELENDHSLVNAIARAAVRGPVPPTRVAHLTIGAAAARFTERLTSMLGR